MVNCGDHALIVHTHRTDYSEFSDCAARQFNIYSNDGQLAHCRMSLAQSDSNTHFALGLLEKSFEQVQDFFLLLQSAEQLSHLLPSQMQVDTDEIRCAFDMHFGRQIEVENALV